MNQNYNPSILEGALGVNRSARKMQTSLLIALSIVGLSLFTSCTNPINAHTAQQYYEFGVEAERGGDLTLAQRNYSRAYGNACMGNLGPKAEAYYLYEFARVTGYAGNYAESEKSFVDVLALIDKAKGEADKLRTPTLAEYALLLHDTGQHAKAVPIYERAIPELERVGILTSDPLGFASLLDDYADSLAAAGFLQRSSEITSRSAAIKDAHKGDTPKYQARRYKA